MLALQSPEPGGRERDRAFQQVGTGLGGGIHRCGLWGAPSGWSHAARTTNSTVSGGAVAWLESVVCCHRPLTHQGEEGLESASVAG